MSDEPMELINALEGSDAFEVVRILGNLTPVQYESRLKWVQDYSPALLARIEGILDRAVTNMTYLSSMAGDMHDSGGEADHKNAKRRTTAVRKALGYTYPGRGVPNL